MANITDSFSSLMLNEHIPRDPFSPQQPEKANTEKELIHTTSEVAHKILKEFGLTSEEFTILSTYYDRNISELKKQNSPLHIRKTTYDLPRSLVYVPPNHGKMEGMYILCKTKGGVREIGLGRYNRATLMLHIDSGKKKVFRTTRIQDCSTLEVDANNAYIARDPEGKYFVAGPSVRYDGPWRPRIRTLEYPRSLNQSTHSCPREENAKKIGFILDYIPQGELFDMISLPLQNRSQTHNENLAICLHLLEGVAMSHQMGLVNLDNKPENIFMDDDYTPKMGDFGAVVKTNEKSPPDAPFTRSYTPPEIHDLISKSIEPFNITPVNEMWSIGCILALITKGYHFQIWLSKKNVSPIFTSCSHIKY